MKSQRVLSVGVTVALLLAFASANLKAQCPAGWLPGMGYPGVSGTANASVVYDDGTGPALYIGGLFTVAGDTLANNIVRWDG